MKNIITLSFSLLSIFAFGQIQENAPWNNGTIQRNTQRPTLQEISNKADAYFNSINVLKKGSGYKPFKRWQYNWSLFTKPDGTIISKDEYWKSWEERNALRSQNRSTDVSNWIPLGPYTNANTYNASNFKQTGQGRVNTVAVDPSNPDTFYVGTPAGGIWKSTDAGVNWTPLTDYLPQIGVSGIAIHPTNSNIIYIATGDDDANDSSAVGVWKSIDGGATWNNTGAIPGNPNSMNEIYIFPNNPETIIVATSTGVQKTTNGGNSWTTKLPGNIVDLKMKPNDPNTWYAVSNSSFFKSTNSGESFTQKTVSGLFGSTRLTMDVTRANNNYIYIVSAGSGSSFNGVYKSTDSGENFTKTNATNAFGGSSQAWYDLALTVSSTNANEVYLGVLDIYKSTNGGNTFFRHNQWNNPNTPTYTHADIHYLRFIDDKFFAGTDGGIFMSENEGDSFVDLTKNLAISQFYRVTVSPENYQAIVGGLQDNGGFGYKNGAWKNYHGADGMEGVVSPNNQNMYYGFMQHGQRLFISDNAGQSITNAVSNPGSEVYDNNPNTPGGAWVTPLSSNSQGELYAGFNKLYKLQNNSWQVISNDLGGDLDAIEIDPNNSDNIYVSDGSSFFKSTDRGANFTIITSSLGVIRSIEVSNSDSNILWIVTNNGVYKSVNILDNSPTFNNISNNLPFDESKIVIKHHERSGNNTIYLGTSLGVYYTSDDLTNWVTFDNNLPNTQVRDLAINEEDSKLIAATYGRGIFMSDIPRQLPNTDVRLASITEPNEGINCGNTITPEISIKNQGTQNLTEVSITYNVNNGANSTYNWTGNLVSNETETVVLPTINNLDLGNYTLNVNINTPNDTYAVNNTKSTSFLLNSNNTNPTTVNPFSTDTDNLLTETNNLTVWERGRVTKNSLSASSGDNAYATRLSGNYADDTTGYLYTNCYDLTSVNTPELSFKMGFDIENEFDYLLVEYSTDRGANWQILGSASDPNWYTNSATQTSQGASLPGAQWTGLGENNHPNGGTNATMHDYSYDLAPFTNEASIIFRFKFFTDANTNEEGVVIDDLLINGVLSADSFNLLSNIAIYPNPSDSIFNIDWNTGDALSIKVFDITGKQIFSKRNIQNNSYQLDLSGYAQGIYLLNLNMNGKTATQKIVKK